MDQDLLGIMKESTGAAAQNLVASRGGTARENFSKPTVAIGGENQNPNPPEPP